MAHTRLTDATIRALKTPSAGQVDYWDQTPGFKGFGVRISKGGSKTFILLHGSSRSRLTLGRYPLLSVPFTCDQSALRRRRLTPQRFLVKRAVVLAAALI